MARAPRTLLRLERASPSLRNALEAARRMGGSHTRSSAVCVLPDGRRYSAVLWDDGRSIQIDCELRGPQDGDAGSEPPGAMWEPNSPVLHGLHVGVAERGRGRRVLRVTGPVDASLEFNAGRRFATNGSGGETSPSVFPSLGGTLHLNGVLVGDLQSELHGGDYSIAFKLVSNRGALPASIRITLGEWLGPRIASLRLAIDDVRVYEESRGRVVFLAGLSELPIPASQDEPGADTLPIPSDPHCD